MSISGKLQNILRHVKKENPPTLAEYQGVNANCVPNIISGVKQSSLPAMGVSEFVKLGERKVKVLKDRLDRGAKFSSVEDEWEVLYPGIAEGAKEDPRLSRLKVCGPARYNAYHTAVLKPIMENFIKDGVEGTFDDETVIQVKIVTKEAGNIRVAMDRLDDFDETSRHITAFNQVMQIAHKAQGKHKLGNVSAEAEISEDKYEAILASFPRNKGRDTNGFADDLGAILGSKEEDGRYTLHNPAEIIICLEQIIQLKVGGSGKLEDYRTGAEYTKFRELAIARDAIYAAKYTLLPVTEYTDGTKDIRWGNEADLEAHIKIYADAYKKCKGSEDDTEFNKRMDGLRVTYNGISDSNDAWAVLALLEEMDENISSNVVEDGVRILKAAFARFDKNIQTEASAAKGEMQEHFTTMIDAFTKTHEIGGKTVSLVSYLDLGGSGLAEDVSGVGKMLWDYTFKDERSTQALTQVERLSRESLFLSGMLVLGFTNTLMDAEILTRDKATHTSTRIAQLILTSSPAMGAAVVEVIKEELDSKSTLQLGTLSKNMAATLRAEDTRVKHSHADTAGLKSGNTHVGKSAKSLGKKFKRWALSKPVLLTALGTAVSVVGLVVSLITLGAIVTGVGGIVAATVATGVFLFLFILCSVCIVWQVPWSAVLFGMVFGLVSGSKSMIRWLKTPNHLKLLWKVIEGDPKATWRYYGSKKQDFAAHNITLERERAGKLVKFKGDLSLVRVQAAQDFLVETEGSGLKALVKAAEKRLVTLGKGSGFNYTKPNNKTEVKRVALQAARDLLAGSGKAPGSPSGKYLIEKRGIPDVYIPGE